MAVLTAEQSQIREAAGTAVTLVCGFLGAGKTSFLRARLREERGRTAVLVNEFGSLGLDGEILGQGESLQVIELPGGCICCSQQLQLTDAVADICRRLRPDRLFIEPSGVAEPSAILRALNGPALAGLIRIDGVITLVDAETFDEYSQPEAFGSFFLDQIVSADLILVNKSDLVSADQLDEIEHRISLMNDDALVVATTFGNFPSPLPARNEREIGAGGEKFRWEQWSLTLEGPITEARIEEFAAAVTAGRFGTILRAKGIFTLAGGGAVRFQVVGRRWTVEPCEARLSPRLICIGFHLHHQALRQFFSDSTDTMNYPQLPTLLSYELP